MKKLLLIIIIQLAYLTTAFCNEDNLETLDLNESIKLAVENNLNIKVSDANVDIFAARHKRSKSPLYPQINFRFIVPFVERESGIFADQLLWDFWRTPSLVKASRATFESSRYNRSTTVNDVILDTKIAYYNLLINKNILQTNKYEVQEFEKKLLQTESFVEHGRKSKLDLTKAKVNRGHAKLNLLNSQKELELAKANFINLLGLEEDYNRQAGLLLQIFDRKYHPT